MARTAILDRQSRQAPAEAVVDVSSLHGYVFDLDVDDAAWGTRDASTVAPSDVVVTLVYHEDGKETGRETHGFCVGARGKDGRPPTISVRRYDRMVETETKTMSVVPATWPAGTTCTVTVAPRRRMAIGLQGEEIR